MIDDEPHFPDLHLIDPERAWRVWTLLEGTDWHFPPDVVERQEDQLMADLMQISSASRLIERVVEEENKPSTKSSEKTAQWQIQQ